MASRAVVKMGSSPAHRVRAGAVTYSQSASWTVRNGTQRSARDAQDLLASRHDEQVGGVECKLPGRFKGMDNRGLP